MGLQIAKDMQCTIPEKFLARCTKKLIIYSFFFSSGVILPEYGYIFMVSGWFLSKPQGTDPLTK